jgi:hypothetical protein
MEELFDARWVLGKSWDRNEAVKRILSSLAADCSIPDGANP